MKKILFILICTLSILIGCGPSNPDNDTNARVMVWQAVTARLKDPSSANFGTCRMQKTSTESWVTDSYVDAKNGFGGNVRMNFHCEVRYNKNGQWDIVALDIE